ncbi:MAG: hypothetical protein SWZ49_33885 [Cyanobacteriota bacterium]|nr:hypothetical protein [Cyanobacteriota bacterium]
MFIRYSNYSKELEITPSKDDLLYLSKKLLEDDAEITASIEDNSKAAPYERFLFGINIKVLSRGLVEFQHFWR